VQTAVDDGKNKRKYFDLTVPNVFLVPGISTTLLLVFRLVQAGNHVLFDNNSWSITQGKRRQLVLQTVPVDGVYEVVTPKSSLNGSAGTVFAAARTPKSESLKTWHRRLGHLSYDACRALATSHAVTGMTLEAGPDPPVCVPCARAKITEAPAPKTRTSTVADASRICHIDLAGPIERSFHGSEYFMVAVYRDFAKVYGLKTKDEAGARTADFMSYIKRQSTVPIQNLKVVRTDGGGEFKTTDFRDLIARQGLLHQHSVRYRSSQNGVAERAIRTVTEMACAMLLDSRLPHYLWEDALGHAAFVRNRVPKKGSGLQQADWIQLITAEVLTNANPLQLTLQIDNQPTIHRIKRDGSSGAQKAVDMRFHALKDVWRGGLMRLEYVPTHDNPADLMTKALSRPELHHKRGLCGLGSEPDDDLGATACGGGVGQPPV